ncbi:MAG: HEAT repeat domain-containing protein [Deltaproteobacteria bacterium]|nr:HEAT repeat domain-containing protein [Deltaproteobacteria bacterium]
MKNTLTPLLVLALLAPTTALAADWEERLSVALTQGWQTQPDTWTRLEAQQPRATRAGHLRFMGPEFNSEAALPLALDRLAHGEEPEPVRAALADVVGRFSADWGDALVELLAEEPAGSVRAVLVLGLRGVAADEAEAGFTIALRDSHAEVRQVAALTVARRADGAVVAPALVDSLSDPSAAVRAAAAQSLGVVGDAQATDALLPLLSDADASVRLRALSALDRLDRSALSAPQLRTLSADADSRVARRASKLLAQ